MQKWTDRLEPRTSGKARTSEQPQPRGEAGAPAFVELLAGGAGASNRCLVEVESQRGGKLRLELQGIAASQLAELIRAFVAG